MIGEIRDVDTAQISVKASLTGHLVLSTIHTNSAVKTISRLIDMGIDPFLVASSLSGVVAQRLVRRVCNVCAKTEEPTENEQEIFAKHKMDIKKVRRAVGCSSCNNKGYKGRTAVFEILDVNDTIVKMISNHEKEYDLLTQARKDGTRLLVEAGLDKVRDGITTVEEILKLGLD